MDIHTVQRPLLTYFRSRRIRFFYQIFQISHSVRVLDLGGTLFLWELARRQGFAVPALTIVNLEKPRTAVPNYAEWVQGNVLELDFADNCFDIIFSNSLIEHLGSWNTQRKFAAEVQRLAPRYFVQTPSRDFPLEPHFLTPFVHWLPKHSRAVLIRNFTIWGLLIRPTKERCTALANEICLLDQKAMAQLFPGSDLKIERVFGLPKSIIAFKA